MIADRRHQHTFEVRAQDMPADLVSALVVLHRHDGTHHICGTVSMPEDDWHEVVRPMLERTGRVRVQDATARGIA